MSSTQREPKREPKREIVEVAVLLPLPDTYSYSVPEALRGMLTPGTRVWVPFGGRGVEGVVLGVGRLEAPDRRLRPVTSLVAGPSLGEELLRLARWMASYYLAPLGEALRLMLPPGGRATEARQVRLTTEGERAAAALGGALEPASLDGLGLRERAVLERLREARGEEKRSTLVRAQHGAQAALMLLEQRGLVEPPDSSRGPRVRQVPVETWVVATPAPPQAPLVEGSVADGSVAIRANDDRSIALGRSAKRRAILDAVRAAGAVPLATLRSIDAQARRHVVELARAGLLTFEERPALSDPFAAPVEPGPPPPAPTADQARALDALAIAVDEAAAQRRYSGFLLHGATGSGKTEVYLRTIERALAAARGALVLVPEIALTPQLGARFRARFGDQVAILHSGLGDRERFVAWTRLQRGEARIALGARSAAFAPVRDLGVVVVDEEHDGSFKQEEGLRYHGRDVALVRAREVGAVAILGSATPSLESYEATRSSDGQPARLRLLRLASRPGARPLPEVRVVDLRRYRREPGSLLSAPLALALQETLDAGEQSILFLNRRGFATVVLCTTCGHRFACRHCAVGLTWHRGADRLVCHYCGYLEATPGRCPQCHAQAVERLGLGTERLEAQVRERFPSARVARLDRDTARGRHGLERLLDAVRARSVDILVGTQMLAKGHDFPDVTLVGVLLADQSMNLPDFRASERTLQLLMQVAGRAGRGDRPGRVLVQTFNPEHAAVRHAAQHDYLGFFDEELGARREPAYPPFVRVGLLRIDGEDEAAVRESAGLAAEAARRVAALAPPEAGVQVLGPMESPIARIKERSRWQLLVKARAPRGVRAVLHAALAVAAPPGVRLVPDVDPVSTL